MKVWAKGRLALMVAATIVFAALTTKPLHACDSTRGCPSNTSATDGAAANALPTYPQATEEAASEPVSLKKFTKKSQKRTAQRTPPRKKATLAQRANAGKYAARQTKQAEPEEAEAPAAKPVKTVAFTVANANAALFEPNTAKADTAEVSEPAQAAKPAPVETEANTAQPASVELVAADEFNELDRVAWEANQMPKLMKLQASDARAELREDDSKWAQTSTIGKLFVAFGALLTLGSAIRMFMA
jgi:hypothetical protein